MFNICLDHYCMHSVHCFASLLLPAVFDKLAEPLRSSAAALLNFRLHFLFVLLCLNGQPSTADFEAGAVAVN